MIRLSVVFLTCITSTLLLIGPTPDTIGQSRKVYSVVDKQPEFPGGKAALSRYLAETIQFPGSLMRQGSDTGPVAAQFVIERDGSIHDVRVSTKPLTRKARRGMKAFMTTIITAVERMPNWRPGEVNSQPVAVFYTLPIEVTVHE